MSACSTTLIPAHVPSQCSHCITAKNLLSSSMRFASFWMWWAHSQCAHFFRYLVSSTDHIT